MSRSPKPASAAAATDARLASPCGIAGTEYGYLTSGELTLTLGFEDHRMAVSDSVCFDSTTPHGYRNDGVESAISIWFVLEDS